MPANQAVSSSDGFAGGAEAKIAARQRFVVAIDFGTSHSGFAYSHKADTTTIEALYQWEGAPQPYAKTLSALLYDSSRFPVAWGYTASQNYRRVPPLERSKYHYITRFKLYLDENFIKNGNKPPEGHTAISLIGDYLHFMRQTIQDTLSLKFGASFTMDSVQWCITVPAMWSDRAKHHTRKAATYAGIVDEPLSPRLSIILEPEAAALYVSSTMKGSLKDGDIFMILDAGGGTVDLTVHQVRIENARQQFAEVAPGHGKSCGSTFVDERFERFFKDKIGEKVYNNSIQNRGEEIAGVMRSWEQIKRSFKGPATYKPKDFESVQIPPKMYREMQDLNPEGFQAMSDAQDGFDDAVHLKPSDIASFFDPIITEVLQLANEMRDRCPGKKVDKIICVGGFTESRYLVSRIRETFEEQGIEVICPADPGATVVKGAVCFGLNPDVIYARRARLTYGLAVRGFWDETYPEDKRTWDRYQKVWMVEDKFDRLVKIGEEVPVNHVATRVYFPPATWSKNIRLSLYASKKDAPRLIDDEGCVQQAEITIPLNLDTNRQISDYPIEIKVKFGASEITICATNQHSNEMYQFNVNYDVSAAVAAPDVCKMDVENTDGTSDSNTAKPKDKTEPQQGEAGGANQTATTSTTRKRPRA